MREEAFYTKASPCAKAKDGVCVQALDCEGPGKAQNWMRMHCGAGALSWTLEDLVLW